jgi:hypothetical protein
MLMLPGTTIPQPWNALLTATIHHPHEDLHTPVATFVKTWASTSPLYTRKMAMLMPNSEATNSATADMSMSSSENPNRSTA